MAPIRSSVTSVNPSHRTFATPSALFVANVSAHDVKDGIDHPQDALSAVPSLAPPHSKPSVATSTPPLRQTPEQRKPHVLPGVVRVPIQIDEAAAIENIQKMRTTTWSLLGKWPLSSLFGLLGGGREPQPGEAAIPTKVVPSAAEEERSKDESPPPPYSLS